MHANASAIFRAGADTPDLVTHARVITGSSFVLLARVLGVDGEPLVPSGVASVRVTGEWVEQSPSPSTVFLSSLQLDGRWNQDDVGYNFALPMVIPSGWSFDGYRLQVTVTTTTGDTLILLWRLQCVDTPVLPGA